MMRTIMRALAILVLFLSSSLALTAPASATPALSSCGGFAAPEKIGLVYSYGVPYANRYLRCGNTGYGYNHFATRWTATATFSDNIRATMQYGNVEPQGTALIFRCYSPIVGCRATTFKVVYETLKYSDGFDKGIITAVYGS